MAAGENATREAGAAVSLHQRIRADIGKRILSGDWQPGHRIPFEYELMAEYGCARMTVNKALSSLTEAGLIERRRRAGSFVIRPTAQWPMLAIPDMEAEVRARGLEYRYELLHSHRRKATKQDRGFIDVARTATVLVLQCRHFAGTRPFALEDRLIAVDEVPDITSVDFRFDSPSAWLLRHVPWHAAQHEISARNADALIAPLLEVAPGSACLVVERHTWREGVAITAVRSWFPGDTQKVVTRFTPSSIIGGEAGHSK
jgi:GntR family histidine utilization transcriptional repressor